jgi:murein DD-endopeptidase MepM/ murein hydrolase activator NlpD
MYQKRRGTYLLYSLVLLAATLLIAALLSLYFSEKTVDAKEQELLLAQKYQMLQKKIAQKEKQYRMLSEDIEALQEQVGLTKENHTQNLKAILQNTSTKVRQIVLEQLPVGYPCSSRRVTSPFGYRMHPIYHEKRFHHGIDFGGKEGIPVHATCDGIVEYAGSSNGGYGNMVIIDHNFGFKTLYGHMMPNIKVKKGSFVKKGTVIGYLGNSGRSTGPHLHYEIKYLRNYIDPDTFLKADAQHFATMLKKSPQIAWQSLIGAITATYQRFTSL